MRAKKGDWVEIKFTLLSPEDRSPHLPEDTKKLPYEARVKGFLEEECAEIGEMVTIRTKIGRLLRGELIAINPPYTHNFGEPIKELLTIGEELRNILRGLKDE